MKIAILAAGTETTLGGESRVACELAEALSKIPDVEVAFAFTGPKNRIYKEGTLTKVSLKGAESDHISDELPFYNASTVQFFFNFLNEFKPDIMHSHSAWAAPFLGQVWAIENNVPYVYTTHMMPSRIAAFLEMDDEKIMHRILTDRFFKGYFLEFLNNCSAVIALNDISKKDVHDYGYNGKSYILPNGRYLDKFNTLKIPDFKSKEKRLIFVGTVTPRKGQEYLLKVMRYLPKNYALTLVGRFFYEDYEKKFRRLARKFRNLEIIGGVNPSQIPSYLEKSHMFVSASEVEVQSLSIIEALAAGKPVVGLSNETVDELIDDKMGKWLSKTSSPKEFARAIKSIMEGDENRYQQLTLDTREKVKFLDWSNIAMKTVDIYRIVVEDYRNSEGKSGRSVLKLLNIVPDFPGKQYIARQVGEWNRAQKGKKKTIIGVPGKTLLFAGVTLGAISAAYYAITLARKLKKKKVK